MKIGVWTGLILLLAGVSGFVRAEDAPRPSFVKATADKPNILFFLTDDESWLERSAYGWSRLPTPAFDRVAREGALFMNGFTSAPSCGPSRACVLTGRHFWQNEQGGFIQGFIPRTTPIVTRILADHGYQVGRTGKGWGPGSHAKLGIPSDSLGRTFMSERIPDPPQEVRDIDYAANFDRFLEWRDAKRPFFFWAGVIEPHEPSGPMNYKLLEKEFGVTLDEVSLPPFMKDTEANRRKRANFVYEICRADTHLARMLKSLEAGGLLDNTIVVVSSDNGTAVVHDGLQRGKASPYDVGVHEPLAIMWPARIKPGRTVTDFVSFADFAPTFLEAAGIKVPASMTGRSLLPILASEKSGRIEAHRDFIVTGLEWHGEFDPASRSCRSIRDDRYAYVVRYDNVDAQGNLLDNKALMKPSQVEFYDLERDPWQMRDLAADPKVAAEKGRLAAKLRQVGLESGDPRVTGEMDLFRRTRQYVQKRKRMGYKKSGGLPFDEVDSK
jgi:N-sulfoglucosamine sulfohydrolase